MEEKKTLRQALRLKNNLVSEIGELNGLIKSNNQIITGNNRTYFTTELIEDLEKKINELVVLKAKIQVANIPVLNKIYYLSELKAMVSTLKDTPTEEGVIVNCYRADSGQFSHSVEIGTKEMRSRIKELESKILTIQDELEEFNAKTLI